MRRHPARRRSAGRRGNGSGRSTLEYIVALSLQAMHGAVSLRDHHAWLPALEILGAVLLLGRRVQRAGLVILLAVYLIAAVVTLHMGHLPLYLVLYAGTAIFLVRSEG